MSKRSAKPVVSPVSPAPADCIRLRGVRQNNLKGFDLDLPLGKYIVVTGLSGAGKSSLVFDTLHAEGQRRYVETFSAYTRQFLDLLDKPQVDSIENIRPSIAIEQTNTVKTSRSTVGTMTELTDFFKVWFSHVAECFDPETGEKVEDDTPQSIWEKTIASQPGRTVVIGFRVAKPDNLSWTEILKNLKGQSYVRVLLPIAERAEVARIDDLLAETASTPASSGKFSVKRSALSVERSTHLFVVQDRITIDAANRVRFLEAVETALHFGQNQVHLFEPDGEGFREFAHYSRGLHSPKTGRTFRPATPALFSFNSPLGACPQCRGFGRVIEIDYRLAIPDQSKSIDEGAIKCWEGEVYSESKRDLLVFAKKKKIPTNVPFYSLTPEQRAFVIEGEPGYGEENGKTWPRYWYGIKGFFKWLEKNTYKMHVRVFLSRFRAYNPCPSCGGTRLQPESLCWKWRGKTLPDLYQIPVGELLSLISQSRVEAQKSKIEETRSASLAFDSIRTRLRYLQQVGLDYLTLDRPSKTLSGGEVQRVNLTSCLGTSLVDTLFVLDEPSVGLHPRDIDRLIAIIRSLTDAGNTVVVVEHDEAMIRAADHVIEIGPEPGSRGGNVVFQGDVPRMLRDKQSITGAYLSGQRRIEIPTTRRAVDADTPRMRFVGATKHNLNDLSFSVPLQRLVCLSGVSGSGKSTLLDSVIHQGLLTRRHELTGDPASIREITLYREFSEIVLVDQSPLTRTPRSNPALYTEAWDLIRELYARTPAAQAAGFNASSFSFNSGDGRCDHCQGLGSERVEMQFLSDVFVPCPVCEGRRFKPETLAIKWRDRSVAELLASSVDDAVELFAEHPAIRGRLATLQAVGLGYLTLGQPLNTLSGGESQRLKLVRYLSGFTEETSKSQAPGNSGRSKTSTASTTGHSSSVTGHSSAFNLRPSDFPQGALLLLDEPTTGLHRHDVKRLLSVLHALVDRGHSVIVIEHNLDVLKSADWILEIGPEAGAGGGRIVAEGPPEIIARAKTATSPFLRAALDEHARGATPELLAAEAPAPYHAASPGIENRESKIENASSLRLEGARENNLKNISVAIPHRELTVVTGVSGSGKSTLLDSVIHQGLLTRRHELTGDPASIREITLYREFSEIVLVDQSPLTRTPRSNPALYTEAWDLIRELYARTPAAQAAGFNASSFSFNSGDGRCDHCQGLGSERVEMQFLSDVFVPCPVCEGRRFKPETLAIKWRDRSVAELLASSVDDAVELFAEHPAIRGRLATLQAVGLGYLTLGQPLNTLSGGESQRLKLVRYLSGFTEETSKSQAPGNSGRSKTSTASTTGHSSSVTGHSSAFNLRPSDFPQGALLLLDEPTTGLHRHDVKRLLSVLHALVDRGHSVIVIEHNLDVLKSADWILEIGPEAGAGGGRIVAEGPPEIIARAKTATSPFLRAALDEHARGATPELLAAEAPAPYHAASPGIENRESKIENASSLRLEGARENNLKNISVAIPHRELTVVTGVSGSGKSTLAFDIVFAEGQRRFMESMSPYARQFVEQLPRPDIDRLTGIPPTVAIEQRVTRGSRKSTVATITEVAQYLRLLYARLGVQHHPDTDHPVEPLSLGQLKKLLLRVMHGSPNAKKAKHLYLCAPLIRGRKGHHQPIVTWMQDHGYTLMRADGRLQRVDTFQKLDRYKEHDVEVVVADLKTDPKPGAALETALRLGKGSCFLITPQGDVLSWFSTTRTDSKTGESFPELDPKHFSFNSPRGWCPSCRGHGRVFPWMLQLDDENAGNDEAAAALRLRAFGVESADDVSEQGQLCPECHGERLNRIARAVKLRLKKQPAISLPALLRCTPSQLLTHLRNLDLDERGRLITQDIVPQIEERLRFLDHVGLGYLSLDRPTETLSGGEAQRIRLAAQLGSNLSGVLYVLDEPSIGLHARDNDRLIETLQSLREKGNTLLVVEHDDELMERADRIIDLGPAAGVHGGELLANGTPAEIKVSDKSLTGLFLARGIEHPLRGAYREIQYGKTQTPKKADVASKKSASKKNAAASATGPSSLVTGRSPAFLTLTGARLRNLKNFDLRLPHGRLVMVAGPSGAGKSTLFRDLLNPAVTHAIKAKSARLTGRDFAKATGYVSEEIENPRSKILPPFDELTGAAHFKSVIEVDQSPIGKTPRSTPATYLGIFDLIRQFFASLPESKMRGYSASRFSFNTAGGRCETCAGAGRIKLEMAFMPDTYLPCDDCRGTRYSADLADITWKGKNIGQVLQLTFEEAAQFFDFHSQLSQVCQLMVDCGLGYLTLGQSSPTLSGGEAQRLKLVTELSTGLASYRERSRGEQPRNLYLLEEPTIGLHLSDCEKLIRVLHSLVDQGHTVVVIEHHLDLLAEADWIIELGPVGGPEGGELLYQGPLDGLLRVKNSPTAPYLCAKLKR